MWILDLECAYLHPFQRSYSCCQAYNHLVMPCQSVLGASCTVLAMFYFLGFLWKCISDVAKGSEGCLVRDCCIFDPKLHTRVFGSSVTYDGFISQATSSGYVLASVLAMVTPPDLGKRGTLKDSGVCSFDFGTLFKSSDVPSRFFFDCVKHFGVTLTLSPLCWSID